jgi:hypothetical protein
MASVRAFATRVSLFSAVFALCMLMAYAYAAIMAVISSLECLCRGLVCASMQHLATAWALTLPNAHNQGCLSGPHPQQHMPHADCGVHGRPGSGRRLGPPESGRVHRPPSELMGGCRANTCWCRWPLSF